MSASIIRPSSGKEDAVPAAVEKDAVFGSKLELELGMIAVEEEGSDSDVISVRSGASLSSSPSRMIAHASSEAFIRSSAQSRDKITSSKSQDSPSKASRKSLRVGRELLSYSNSLLFPAEGKKKVQRHSSAKSVTLRSHSSAKSVMLDNVGNAIMNAEAELRRRQNSAGLQIATSTGAAGVESSPAKSEISRRSSSVVSHKNLLDLLLVDGDASQTKETKETKESIDNTSVQENIDAIHLAEIRKLLYESALGGQHATKEAFIKLFEAADNHVVDQIWKKYAVKVDGHEEKMISIDDICNIWVSLLSKHDASAKRLDFLCTLLDTDADGTISKDEFASFLEESSGKLTIDQEHFRNTVDIIFEEMRDQQADDVNSSDEYSDDLTYDEVRMILSELGLDTLIVAGDAGDAGDGRDGRDGGAGTLPRGSHVGPTPPKDLPKPDPTIHKSICCECCTRRYCVQNTVRIVWLAFFFVGMLCSMIYKYWRYCNNITWSQPFLVSERDRMPAEWGWTRPDVTNLMGRGVCFARSGSQGTMWCAMCLLWPICRGFLVKLRAIPGAWRVIPFDDRILFHKVAAWSLLFCTAVHVVAHLYNYSLYHVAPEGVWNVSVLGKKSGLDAQPDYWEVALLTLPGTTGHIMLIIMIFSYAFVLPADFTLNCSRAKKLPSATRTCCGDQNVRFCRCCTDERGKIHLTKCNCKRKQRKVGARQTMCSNEDIKFCRCCVMKDGHCNISGRDACYNKFWFSHQLLWTVWMACFVAHGTGEWLEVSLTWAWVVVPLTIFCAERCFKSFNKDRHTTISDAEILSRGQVVMLVIKRTAFLKTFRPGMYVQVKVPQLSNYEWHPFTISSSPSWQKDYLTLHIQGLGDWTNNLIELVRTCQVSSALQSNVVSFTEAGESLIPYPKIQLAGPFGAPTEAWQKFETILLVGAGIGVTPFMSIIKEITALWSESTVPPEIAEHIRKAQKALEKLGVAQAAAAKQAVAATDKDTNKETLVDGRGEREGEREGEGGKGAKTAPSQAYAKKKIPSILFRESVTDLEAGSEKDEEDTNTSKSQDENNEDDDDHVDTLESLLAQAKGELEISLNKSLVTLYPQAFRVKKVYFHFITRGQETLQWFADEISCLAALDPESRIEIHMHLTRHGQSPLQMKLLRLARAAGKTNDVDILSNIKGKTQTHLGRPDWQKVFGPISRKYGEHEQIGVFFCGPEIIRKTLNKECISWSRKANSPDFIMHSEKF